MKNIKLMGLALIAATVLTAFFGTSTASATSLDDGAGNALGVNSKIDTSLNWGTARLESTSGSILDTCTGSTIKGVITSTGGTLVEGSVAKADLTWSGCTNTTDTLEGGTLAIASNNAVTGKGFEVTVETLGTSCIYGLGFSSVTLGTLEESDTNAVLDIETVVTEQTTDKFLCPNDTVWNAEYRVTSPTGLTVTGSEGGWGGGGGGGEGGHPLRSTPSALFFKAGVVESKEIMLERAGSTEVTTEGASFVDSIGNPFSGIDFDGSITCYTRTYGTSCSTKIKNTRATAGDGSLKIKTSAGDKYIPIHVDP